MANTKYYHMSREKLPNGTPLKVKGAFHVEPKVEDILSSRKPDECVPRSESIFLSPTPDVRTQGLTYDEGYLHIVEPSGRIERRDNSWIGELQKRHHANEKIRCLRDSMLSNLTDDDLADNYWRGTASNNPTWEIVAEAAVITDLVSDNPVAVRPSKFKFSG